MTTTTTKSSTEFLQEYLLCYLQLTTKKKSRVDRLMAMMRQSDDAREHFEIAKAIQEIVFPLDISATIAFDIEEGVNPSAKGKVAGYRQNLGREVRKRRQELGLTQEVVAERSGLPQSHICRIENGMHTPTETTIEKLAKALEIEPGKLDLLYRS